MPVKQILILFFSVALFCGCGGEDSPFVPDEMATINFYPQVDNASTRAEAASTASLREFGVYALVNAPTPYLLMEDEHIYKNPDNKWAYDNIKYWPANQTVSFYAYAPYADDNVVVSYDDKTITCTIPDDPDRQFDLMVSEAPGKTAADGTVGLLFEHLLSRVDFAVSANDNVNDVTVTLNTFQIVINDEALPNNGVYNLTTETWNISNDSYINGGTHELVNTDTPVPGEGWKYTMLLLPQEIQQGSITANISYSIAYDGTTISNKQVSIPLSQIACEQGKKYTYNFTITLTGVDLKVEVLPWNTDEKEIEI